MKNKHRFAGVFLWVLLVGCTTVRIPPEQTAWADSVRQQIAQATETRYVYIPVADQQQRDIVEDLASRQGKQTQRIKKDGQMMECVFLFSRFELPWPNLDPFSSERPR
ncbi:MAG: hypothetical protein HY735_35070 [Verrucomicrobia bacterium]|nr:hypothetical protein [Verrucomicrobiota bacterium]